MQSAQLPQQSIVIRRLNGPDPGSRHDHTVRRFSGDYSLLVRLREFTVAEQGSVSIIRHVCRLNDIPVPDVTFHGGRGPHTGFCRAPRGQYVIQHGEESIVGWEQAKGKRLPEDGMIRLGRLSSLATIAHECGHHLVHHDEGGPVAPHGKIWVHRFDLAARGVTDWLERAGVVLGSPR